MTADYEFPRFISSGVQDLIEKILNTDEEERYTVSHIMNHPWFNRVNSFPWPLSSINGKLTEEDIQEYLISESCGGVNIEIKEVPVNQSIISVLDDYGCNREYAIKCVQMNKHNSVTSTYYLLLKCKKREFIQNYEKNGKCINKYFEISNEKQELIDLLMNFEPSSKKKNKESKTIELPKEKSKPKREIENEKLINEFNTQNKKVENIEIVPKSKSQERKLKKPIKGEIDIGYSTIDPTSHLTTMKGDHPKPEFQTVDYTKSSNSRNNTTLTNADPNNALSIQPVSNDEISSIKNRRTGSTDCTNSKKLHKNVKIPNFNNKGVIEIDTAEGEIIMSNRYHPEKQNSPSPSPAKYNLAPMPKPLVANFMVKGNQFDTIKT